MTTPDTPGNGHFDVEGNLESSLTGSAKDGTWKGTYTIAGDRLRVTTDAGATLDFAIHAAWDTGQRSEKIVMINGGAYARRK